MYHVHVMTSVEHTSVIRQLQEITETLEVEKDTDRSVGRVFTQPVEAMICGVLCLYVCVYVCLRPQTRLSR